MDRIAPTTQPPELHLRTPQLNAEPGPAAKAADRRFAEHVASLQTSVLPDDVTIQLDAEAGRFVSTLTDSVTTETLRRYPSESQLAYARAVMAYMRALTDGQS